MVTSATNSSWPLDWTIQEWKCTGLPKPCVVRLSLFSLDERLILNRLGALTISDRRGVAECLRQLLPLHWTATGCNWIRPSRYQVINCFAEG